MAQQSGRSHPTVRTEPGGQRCQATAETEALPADARTDTNLDGFVDLAGQTVGDYSYTRFPPHRPVVLHATHDKAHLRGGYFHYTPEGELISETRSVGISIYKGGVWGGGGGLGQVTHHDRSNSMG